MPKPHPTVSASPACSWSTPTATAAPTWWSPPAPRAGYYPMSFAGGWSQRSFQPYRQAPSVELADPNVKLIDLDGDGLTDVLCWVPAWCAGSTIPTPGGLAAHHRRCGPVSGLDLADPGVRLADMTGDGLRTSSNSHGNVAYWPNLGHGRFGSPVRCDRAAAARRVRPGRLLLGDVDGDGAADLVYVIDGRVLLWGNQSGNGWTTRHHRRHAPHGRHRLGPAHRPYRAGDGRPAVEPAADGSGRSTAVPRPRRRHRAGPARDDGQPPRRSPPCSTARPRVLPADDQRSGDPLADHPAVPGPRRRPGRRVDEISQRQVNHEYRYHHGYWDGVEREFRGFAMVEQFDTETSGITPSTRCSSRTDLTARPLDRRRGSTRPGGRG